MEEYLMETAMTNSYISRPGRLLRPDEVAATLNISKSLAYRLLEPAFSINQPVKLLASEGMRPELDQCVRCGESEPDVALVSFDLNEGGVLCRSCRSGHAVTPGALDVMREILGGQLVAALARDESATTHEVSSLATRALEFHIERRLKAVAMFETH
jgi:recombinational DNA repair protein (RecF pathway)